MIRDQFILDLNNELIVDNFAGGGGASTGIEIALGRHVDYAVNHDAFALGMHRINHPQTVHHCEDVFDIDPVTVCGGRPVGLAHFSPDCKHYSVAKGGKPVEKKIRGLMFSMLLWAKYRARVLTMENVSEIRTAGPLKWMRKNGKLGWYPDRAHSGRTWRLILDILGSGCSPTHPDLPEVLEFLKGKVTMEDCVRGFGYVCEDRDIRACDLGSPTIRKRCYMIARRDGKPIVWPKATHANPDKLGTGQKAWRTVGECLDWSLPCPSIFLTREEAKIARCKRPLVRATQRRIAMGVDRHVLKAKKPFIVNLTHQGGDRTESISEPIRTITGARNGEKAIICPVFAPMSGSLVGTGGPAYSGKPTSLDKPLGAMTTENHKAIAVATMVKLRGTNVGNSAAQPGDTISAGGQHHGLVVAHMTKFCTGSVGQELGQPAPTVTAGSHRPETHGGAAPTTGLVVAHLAQQVEAATLTKYYGLTPKQLEGARRVAAFLRKFGVKFEGEFATVGGYIIIDIGMRMLTPRELFRAQGFPDKYVIDRAWLINPLTGDLKEVRLTKEQQIRMCGNSVCPQVMAALVRANVPELRVQFKERRRHRYALA